MSIGAEFRRLFRIGGYADRAEEELDEELAFHFRETVEEFMEEGMGRDGAEREARRRFGDEEHHRDRILAEERARHERARRWGPLRAFGSDLASAARGLLRSPAFAIAVVLTLALGIGANATMFRVVERLLLSPPDQVEDPAEVRRIFASRIMFNDRLWTSPWLPYPDYVVLTEVKAFEQVAAFDEVERTLGSGSGAERIQAGRATASLFPLLGVDAAIGRFYTPDEDIIGAPVPTAVLAYHFWERRFGADPGVLGTRLEIGDGTYTVVGVAPEGFTGVELTPVDVWLPIHVDQELATGTEDWARNRGWTWLRTVARLAPGVGIEAAEEEATAAYRAAWAAEGSGWDPEAEIVTASLVAADEPEPSRAGIVPENEGRPAAVEAAAVSRWLAGVAVVVLLIACANVANLLLTRAIRRRRELAVRVALGISRSRLMSQVLSESLLLALAGGAAALLVARFGGPFVTSVLLPELSFDEALSPALFAFTGVAVVLAALLSGVVPALHASRIDVEIALRGSGRGGSAPRSRTRLALLTAQAGLSVVLLVGAGLFVRSLGEVGEIDLGIEPDGLSVAHVEMVDGISAAEVREVLDRVVQRIEALPSVRSAAVSLALPFGSTYSRAFEVPGVDSIPSLPSGGPYVYFVTPGFLETMGLTVVRGRSLEPSDDREGIAPAVVVNATMARLIWPEEDPLGRCVYVGREGRDTELCSTVVGVVEDFRRDKVADEDQQMLYFVPATAAGVAPRNLVVRASADPEAALGAVRQTLVDFDPRIRYIEIQPFSALYQDQLRAWRLGATMFTAFGFLALLVAGLGLYSAVGFQVVQRRRELGIRSALGAQRPSLVGAVVRESLGVVVLGVVGGVAAAFALSPRIEPLLYEVSARDPLVYLGVSAILIAVAAVAAAAPAARATRVDPRQALQAE